jgi:hypothetical protein
VAEIKEYPECFDKSWPRENWQPAKICPEIHALIDMGIKEIEIQYPRLFMAMEHHCTTQGRPLTFSDKQWLLDIYQDNNSKMVIVKSSQVGITELALCAMFDFAKAGKRGLYILPSKEHRKTFVSDRINRQKEWSEYYAQSIKETMTGSDSNVYKTIFGQGWKYVGSNIRSDFFEFPCQVLFFDEYDLLDQENIIYALDRVSSVRQPIIWKFGNPTRSGFGISLEFIQSDQREWHVECEHCGCKQILDWYRHFVESSGADSKDWCLKDSDGRPICQICQQPFNRLNDGQWIALNPDSTISGYHISQLFVSKNGSSEDILDLFAKFQSAQNSPTALQNFHNNYLGITFENSNFKVTDDVLNRCHYQGDIQFDPKLYRTVMGVDQGKTFTCVISMVWENEIIDVYYAQVKRWADVVDLEQKFNVTSTVVDAQGGGYAEVRDFISNAEHRYACYYRPKDQIKTPLYNLKQAEQIVEVNRTELLDTIVKRFIDNRTHTRSDWQSVLGGEYKKQMTASSRIIDAGGRPVWTKGDDHFFHATAYCHLAKLVSGMSHSVIKHQNWRAQSVKLVETVDTESDKPKRNWHSG